MSYLTFYAGLVGSPAPTSYLDDSDFNDPISEIEAYDSCRLILRVYFRIHFGQFYSVRCFVARVVPRF
jgi:hypothetical protein